MKRNFVFISFMILSQFCFGQYGVLDMSFNGVGHNGTLFQGDSRAKGIMFLPNGKILFFGDSAENTTVGDRFAGFARVNEDGVLDSTFGNNGSMRKVYGTNSNCFLGSVFQVNDDTFYITTYYGSLFSLTKVSSDFVTDTTYGNNGYITLLYGYSFSPTTIIPDVDGSFLAIGRAKQTSSSPYGIAMGKYRANGTVDTAYGTNGFIFFPLNDIPSTDNAGTVYFLNDGKYLVIGNYLFTDVNNVQRRNFFLKKFNADATVDTTYGTNGKTLSSEISGTYLTEVAEDGSVSILGNPTTTLTSPTSVRTIQFDANGNYINQPITYYETFLPNVYIYNVRKQTDGKVLIAGQYMDDLPIQQSDSFVCRFLPTGQRDTTFGVDGRFKASFGGIEYINNIKFAPDQKLVFTGTRIYNGHYEFLMGRLTTGITLGIIDFNQDGTIKAYPNPVQSVSTLDYELKNEEKITISLYDLNGKLIQNILKDTLKSQGQHSESLDLNNFQEGTYIIEISNGIYCNTVKVIKQ